MEISRQQKSRDIHLHTQLHFRQQTKQKYGDGPNGRSRMGMQGKYKFRNSGFSASNWSQRPSQAPWTKELANHRYHRKASSLRSGPLPRRLTGPRIALLNKPQTFRSWRPWYGVLTRNYPSQAAQGPLGWLPGRTSTYVSDCSTHWGQSAAKLDFVETDVVSFFEKKNRKAHINLEITTIMMRSTVRVLNICAGLNLFRTPFFPVNLCLCIRPIQNMSFKSV